MFITACNECGNSPQTVSRPIRHTFTHKKAPLPKIAWTCRGGGGRPLRLPPGSATGRSTPEYADNFGVEGTRDYATVRGPGVKGVLGT